MTHCARWTTLPALVLPLFFLLSSLIRPCISLLECPVTGVVAAEDGALELLLLEATKTVVTLVVTLVYCFPWSSFCASSGSEESGAYGGGGLLCFFLHSGKERADGGSTPLLVLHFLPVLGSFVGFASSLFLSYPAHSLCLSLLYTLFLLFFCFCCLVPRLLRSFFLCPSLVFSFKIPCVFCLLPSLLFFSLSSPPAMYGFFLLFPPPFCPSLYCVFPPFHSPVFLPFSLVPESVLLLWFL